jgi:hypothetical protein
MAVSGELSFIAAVAYSAGRFVLLIERQQRSPQTFVGLPADTAFSFLN